MFYKELKFFFRRFYQTVAIRGMVWADESIAKYWNFNRGGDGPFCLPRGRIAQQPIPTRVRVGFRTQHAPYANKNNSNRATRVCRGRQINSFVSEPYETKDVRAEMQNKVLTLCMVLFFFIFFWKTNRLFITEWVCIFVCPSARAIVCGRGRLRLVRAYNAIYEQN